MPARWMIEMKLIVLGATGGTGLEIVRQATEKGHSEFSARTMWSLAVTALVRSLELYTVCDFRASGALGVNDGNDVNFYVAYLKACREISKNTPSHSATSTEQIGSGRRTEPRKVESEKHRCL